MTIRIIRQKWWFFGIQKTRNLLNYMIVSLWPSANLMILYELCIYSWHNRFSLFIADL